jgi:putative oxidoreductase
MSRTNQPHVNAALWTAQIALAAVFSLSGFLKATVPAAELQGGLGLLTEAQAGILRPVGIVELILGLALVIPAGARVLPRLTPFAAVCLGAITLLGSVQPASAGGLGLVFPNLALLAGAAFVAWGRLVAAPIEAASFGPELEVVDPAEAARLERNRQRHAARSGVAPRVA